MKKILLFAAAICLAGCNYTKIVDTLQELRDDENNTKVDFSYSMNGKTVTFQNTSDLKVSAHYWDFGDGNGVLDKETVSHTYTENGTYKVILEGRWKYNGNTQKKDCEKYITISGGSSQTDPDENKTVYLKGYKVYKIPQDGWYKINCTINGFMAQSVSVSTDETKLQTTVNYILYVDTRRRYLYFSRTNNGRGRSGPPLQLVY